MITKEWVKRNHACKEGVEFFNLNFPGGEGDEETIARLLIQANRMNWANWFIMQILSPKDRVYLQIFFAQEVLPIFEKKYPQDNRPRKAIEAAKDCINHPSVASYVAAAYAANDADDAANIAGEAAADAYDAIDDDVDAIDATYAYDAIADVADDAAYASNDAVYAAADAIADTANAADAAADAAAYAANYAHANAVDTSAYPCITRTHDHLIDFFNIPLKSFQIKMIQYGLDLFKQSRKSEKEKGEVL